jgi:hypothetical protein
MVVLVDSRKCVAINFLNSGDVRYLWDIGQFTETARMPMDVADLI